MTITRTLPAVIAVAAIALAGCGGSAAAGDAPLVPEAGAAQPAPTTTAPSGPTVVSGTRQQQDERCAEAVQVWLIETAELGSASTIEDATAALLDPCGSIERAGEAMGLLMASIAGWAGGLCGDFTTWRGALPAAAPLSDRLMEAASGACYAAAARAGETTAEEWCSRENLRAFGLAGDSADRAECVNGFMDERGR